MSRDPEVMLEVEVLEVSRDRLSEIGIVWPDNATISTPPSAETLGQMRDLTTSQLLITPLSVTLNLKLQEGDANLLASPRIRTRNKEKARIMIGDKVPVITNSVTPIQTGSAVVTGTVQYLEVGIKLEVEPQIYAEGDVGIKLNLEVSNIVKEVRNLQSGTLAYQIGSRSAQTNLRMRDGETQILGGLISDLDRNTATKVPGLGQLPVLGRLFSSHGTNATKTEIILSITPRIVRSPVIAGAGVRNVYAGTDAQMRETPLRLDPVGAVHSQPSGGTTAPGATGGGRPTPARPPAAASDSSSAADAPTPAEVPAGGMSPPVVNRINRSRGSVGTTPTPSPAPQVEPSKPADADTDKPAEPERRQKARRVQAGQARRAQAGQARRAQAGQARRVQRSEADPTLHGRTAASAQRTKGTAVKSAAPSFAERGIHAHRAGDLAGTGWAARDGGVAAVRNHADAAEGNGTAPGTAHDPFRTRRLQGGKRQRCLAQDRR